MKKIANRKSGKFLTKEEALSLCSRLKRETGATYVEHTSVYGYPTAEMAEKANLAAVCETYTGYTFAFAGAINRGLEGYKVRVICIKDLPANFEQLFPDYVVIG